jgi:hypothetical protein
MRVLAFASLAALALGVSACASSDKPAATPASPPASSQAWGEIVVADQAVRRGTITIRHLELTNGGFVVVHEMDAEGKPVAPGNIGYRAIGKGDSNNVVVRLTKPVPKGAKLMVMLHDDTGKIGTYEFAPGATAEDKPTIVNGAAVTKMFTVK